MINYSIVMRGNPTDKTVAKKAYASAQYSPSKSEAISSSLHEASPNVIIPANSRERALMDRFVLISFVIMDYLSLSLRFDNILASATTAFIADGHTGIGPPTAIATSPYT